MLTSIPVWALTFANLGSAFAFYMIQTEIPTYLSTIQHFSLTSVTLLDFLVESFEGFLESIQKLALRSQTRL